VVLGVLTGLEAVVFAALGMLGRGTNCSALLGSGSVEIVIAVVMVMVSSMVVGLTISARIDNADRGVPLLVLVVMLQLMLFEVQGEGSSRAVVLARARPLGLCHGCLDSWPGALRIARRQSHRQCPVASRRAHLDRQLHIARSADQPVTSLEH
jgi:hypothetical protein